MKKITLLLLCIIAFIACSKEPLADRIKGSYGCEVRLLTRYQKDGKWRDTSYISKENNSVVISRVDDNTVAIKATCKKWGEGVATTVSIDDNNYAANFSGSGTFMANGKTYDAMIDGSCGYDSHDIAVSVRIVGSTFPSGSGNKYILSFTNKR